MPAPTYHEIAPSPKPEFYENHKGELHFRATRLLNCAWDDLSQLVTWLYTEEGALYPHTPGSTLAIVRKVRPMSRGRISGTAELATYTGAIVEVWYSTEGPRWVSGMLVEEAIVPEDIFIRPPGGLQWSDDVWVTDTETATPIRVLGASHVLRVERSTTYPTDAFAYVGMCNAGTKTCMTFNYTFPSQTVLYQPPAVASQTDFSVGTRYTYTYRNSINPHGWNKFLNVRTGAWEYLYHNGDIFYLYPPSW